MIYKVNILTKYTINEFQWTKKQKVKLLILVDVLISSIITQGKVKSDMDHKREAEQEAEVGTVHNKNINVLC